MPRSAAQITSLGLLALCAASCAGSSGNSSTSSQGDIPGYEHTLARSSFNVGTVLVEHDVGGMHQVEGSVGTFSTQIASRAATAIPNSVVPLPGDVYPGDDQAQNQAVVNYFRAAGLPGAQVSLIEANQTGISSPGEDIAHASTIAWYSVLHRGLDGIPVEDSTAWAILRADGTSLEEQVYWPSLPTSIRSEISAFRSQMNDSSARQRYLARLPSDVADASVVVRHTSWFWAGPFEARVACRVLLSTGSTLYFDIDAQPLKLSDE